MTDNKKGNGGIGLCTLLQVIFALCYYADPCHNNKDKECSTKIANWQEWQVWLPTIISLSLYSIYIIGKVSYTVYTSKEKKEHSQFYTIDNIV